MAFPCGLDCSQSGSWGPGGRAREHMEGKHSKRPSERCLAFNGGSLRSHMELLLPYSNWLNSLQPTQIQRRRHRPHLSYRGISSHLKKITYLNTDLFKGLHFPEFCELKGTKGLSISVSHPGPSSSLQSAGIPAETTTGVFFLFSYHLPTLATFQYILHSTARTIVLKHRFALVHHPPSPPHPASSN